MKGVCSMKLISIIVAMAAAAVIAVPASAGSPNPRLDVGSRGPAVKKLQKGLHIQVDGVFGPGTRAAVVALQARYGLVTDGVVGPGTWQVWSEKGSMKSVLASFDSRTKAAAKKNGWAIELHLHGNEGSTRVLHYSAGKWSLPVASPSSSAGWARDKHGVLRYYTTCTGVYYLGKPDPLGINAYSSEYHHAAMAWARYWCGGEAFHQDGLYASHGCVHLPSYADAELIWKLPGGIQVLSVNQ